MSLYYEAASLLSSDAKLGGSFKSRIYSSKNLKSPPAQIYALVAECAKWDHFLKQVIENAGLLDAERKLTPLLALLLTHDLILSKRGIAAPANHPLRVIIEKHKTRLRAEFTKLRVKRGCATVEDLKASIVKEKGSTSNTDGVNPRWVRINNVVTTLDHELGSTFASFKRVESLVELERIQVEDSPKDMKERRSVYYVDRHIPDLIAVPQSTELTSLRAYKGGRIILQDKASCFPAYLLLGDAGPQYQGKLIDGCAAPGNKTTHLASLLRSGTILEEKKSTVHMPRIYSLDASKVRSKTLKKMVHIAGADGLVTVLEGQDFLALDPRDKRFRGVNGILLDPSCSGSGIQGRDDVPDLMLPESSQGSTVANGKKRKRRDVNKNDNEAEYTKSKKKLCDGATPALPTVPEGENEIIVSDDDTERLIKLSNLQTRIVEHALGFPAAKCVTYSTCSIHGLENENVVYRVLNSDVARKGKWKLLGRENQVDGLREWIHRGVPQAKPVCRLDGQSITWSLQDEELDACLRCYQGNKEGTGGFFVAAFVREQSDIEAGRVVEGEKGEGQDEEEKEEKGEEEEEAEEGWEGSHLTRYLYDGRK
ncbi:putative 28S rRNA (cytosine-C(5))-methyltransferase [Ascosphaera aggregata]|nr:putative 28S rRNA (cytosine-C(5))-methyltransferase [Ascosphaera aggregata]